MEQPISKLPTSSNFHLTASEPQLIPPRLDFLSASYGRSSGSSSTEFGRSWEERILDLSAELQQICGSPLSPPCSAVTGARSPDILQWLTTTVASPPPRRLTATSPRSVPLTAADSASDKRAGLYSTTTTPLRLTCSLGRSADGSSTADLVRRTISLNAGHSPEPVGGRPRPIMVRHEETHETLAQRLSAICGKSSQAVGVAVKDHQTTLTPETPRSTSSMRANVAAGDTGSGRVRIKADVDACHAEDLVVSVYDGRQLTVDAYDGPTTRRLHQAELPSGVADCLLCHMNSSGSVYILERPRGTGLSVEFSGTKSIFLPVIHCDEVQLMMTLVLRVPDDFRFEDLAVKTVDNNVWITGGGKLGTSSLSVSGSDMFSFTVRRGPGSRSIDGAKERRFKVVIPLPKGCDNRSVVAALSSNNQLVLKAKLSAACRRYTF